MVLTQIYPRRKAVIDGVFRETAHRIGDIQRKGFDNAKVQRLLRCLRIKEIPSSGETTRTQALCRQQSHLLCFNRSIQPQCGGIL